MLSVELCEQARLSRDSRFDGHFFTGVLTTGIYCRPICPAPPPKPENVIYYPSAAAATAAGLRPCLRCRPESSPGTPSWNGTESTVHRALTLINEGALDDHPVSHLAERLGIGERHLRRLFQNHLGAGPAAIDRTRKLLFAGKLLSETHLPINAVAGASGFQSVRRFNAMFRSFYDQTPTAFRKEHESVQTEGDYQLLLHYRPPYDWQALSRFLADRTLPGVELFEQDSYARTIRDGGHVGYFRIRPHSRKHALSLHLVYPEPQNLLRIVTRIRQMFDLDADSLTIDACLGEHKALAASVEAFPGMRIPGAWDGFELAVRAVLGQQISVAAARTLACRILERFGTRLDPAPAPDLNRIFPTPQVLATASLADIGLTAARQQTITTLARAFVDGSVDLNPEQDLDTFMRRWTALRGIGEWTAHYIAMRALHHPDAFPAGDLILRKVASSDEQPLTQRALTAWAEPCRPWRAYSVFRLWRTATS